MIHVWSNLQSKSSPDSKPINKQFSLGN